MSKYICTATPNGFVPNNEYWEEYEDSFDIGYDYIIEAKKKRNEREIKFHRLYFAMLQSCWRNSDIEHKIPFDIFRKEVIKEAGFFTSYTKVTRKYLEDNSGNRMLDDEGKPIFWSEEEEIRDAKSISFAKMGEDEFKKLVSASKDVLIDQYLPMNTTAEDVDRMAMEIINFGSR